MITIYGIKNCQSMKKAFDFLSNHHIPYQFFDYKKSVLSQETFDEMTTLFGLNKVINKQGTTYKKLNEQDKQILVADDLFAIYQVVKNNQSLLKRPIIIGTYQQKIIHLIGFDELHYTSILLEN